MTTLPAPAATPLVGHLWRWSTDPVRLLADGARTGDVFRLRLWRPAVVGYTPDWNRAVLGDLDTFRSIGSLSGLTPYLSAGVVYRDQPEHDPRRRELNPHFHSRGLAHLTDRLDQIAHAALPPADPPAGPVEALAWASGTVRRMLNAAFFGGALPDRLLAAFLHPLQQPVPGPMLPRPMLFRRLDAAIARVLADPPPGTLAHALAGLDGAVAEIRVGLAAGYDTTAHTLAWALWHLAGAPEWCRPEALPQVMDEVLRLYPAGWLGSRITARAVTVTGVPIPAGTLVLYSPFLTHRDPRLWPDPLAFKPDRFDEGRPAWGFLPFSAGRRTCLGAHLARAMLHAALTPWFTGKITQVDGDPRPAAAIALRPSGPLWIERHP
ncbi:cytochrome P450 [Catellatospora bangladeshensis]|uniref:Cytochrome P450 n=1 Tax=Catellatospora bangladeshensis TaxID=310355 RepID=A0A8J3JMR8_9ACTN|nr:cytochrome P450 [Catellatospora bangladeshensis]GIF81810.1 cytochrome P450 [Catellatospora bangladeshensis]